MRRRCVFYIDTVYFLVIQLYVEYSPGGLLLNYSKIEKARFCNIDYAHALYVIQWYLIIQLCICNNTEIISRYIDLLLKTS